jgi:hypothetical protein
VSNSIRWFAPDVPYNETNFNGFMLFAPETRLGQHILYIGDGAEVHGQLFDAVAWLAAATNSSGQLHGQLAPRVTLGFKIPPVGLNYGGYNSLYRFEPFDLTLNTPFNVNTNEPWQIIFQHNNTNLAIWGADWWTNRYIGTNIAIGNLARANGRNGIAIGGVTNDNVNTVNIGFGGVNSAFYSVGVRLANNALSLTPTTAEFFSGGMEIDVNGNVEASTFTGDIDPINLTAGTAGISISGNAATATALAANAGITTNVLVGNGVTLYITNGIIKAAR